MLSKTMAPIQLSIKLFCDLVARQNKKLFGCASIKKRNNSFKSAKGTTALMQGAKTLRFLQGNYAQ